MATLSGVDLSRWQGTPNFALVKQTQQFAIIKSSEGSSYRDPQFYRNQSQARVNGLLVGMYHFARPDLNSPEKEAAFFLATAQPRVGEILCLDFETSFNGSPPVWCKTFLDYVSRSLNGYKPLVYLNRSTANGHNWNAVIAANYGLWLAAYDGNPTSIPTTPWPTLALKQYSSTGRVSGIVGNVDMNTFYGSAETFKLYGVGGGTAPSETVTIPKTEYDSLKADRVKLQTTLAALRNILG